MTPESREALERIAGPVSRETWDSLLVFVREFDRWAKQINLIAPSTVETMFERHVLDSAQLLPLAPHAKRWLDLGSGGGFPGAVVAILLKDRPGAHVDLVESNRKKASFLTAVLARAGAPAKVHATRIEDAERAGIGMPEIVTARALAPLEVLLELAEPWLEGGTRGLFHKGREWRREIEESPRAERYVLVSRPSAVDAESVILDVSGRRKDQATGAESAERPS
jgi:16S rRNA (guanine527-N7)-methyltransferase